MYQNTHFGAWGTQKSYDQLRQHIKKQRHYFANEGPSSQSYGFSSSYVWMWELDYKESWALKNWCFWTVVLEKTPESPLDCKEIKPVHPKGNQSWIFTWRTDAEAEIPILWSPDAKNWLIGKDPDAGKDSGQEEKGTTEDEMVGWHHWLNGHEFEQALGVGDGQGSLAWCSPWGHKETQLSNWIELNCGTQMAPCSHISPWGMCAQLCLTLWDPMDDNPPASPVHGISRARILEWIAISFSRHHGGSCLMEGHRRFT